MSKTFAKFVSMKNISRFAAILALTVLPFVAFAAEGPDYSRLTADNHPRLFFGKEDFKAIPKALRKKSNPYFCALHEQMMETADSPKFGQDPAPLEYRKDASEKRILNVSRHALRRIVSDAYAYRITKDKKYLRHVETDLNDVCDFPDWNPSHFLDTGEMSLGVAIAYDWLYEYLSKETRQKIEDRLKRYGLDAWEKRCKGFWRGTNNWNQVCNAGIVAAALAIYELYPEECRFYLEEAPKSNRIAVDFCYSPDGAYPEGPGYWDYGTSFQTILNSEYEFTLGYDFGLSENDGFRRTGYYNLHCQDANRRSFNYSDGSEKVNSRPCLWYFARKFDDPGLLYTEKFHLENHGYVGNRVLFCGLANAWRCNFKAIPAPGSNMYTGQGVTPVAFFRTGWGKDDLWLGIKAGKGTNPHAHLDAGTFVFTAYGVRWAMDAGQPAYSYVEAFFKKRGKGILWDMREGSDRWNLLCYNNRCHNTLTVNDRNFKPDSLATLDDCFNSPSRMGATVTLTPVFGGDLDKAVRTAAIVDGDHLEVTDELVAPAGCPAHVRWNFITRAKVRVSPEGIVLRHSGIDMVLKAEGASVEYKAYPLDRDNAGLASDIMLKHLDGTRLCGFEFDIPAGGSVKLVTTLRKK